MLDSLNTTNTSQNKAFDLIGLNQLRNDSQFNQIDGSGVAVAVIDTGINSQHSLLKDNYKYGYDFVNEDNNPDDISDHGTSVAGVIGAKDQTIGVAPKVGLIALKASDSGIFYNDDILQSLQWVLDNYQQYNIVAVNLSFAGDSYTSESQINYFDAQYNMVQKLEQAGITVVAAAGNSYYTNQYQNLGSPAIYSTLAVGGVWAENVGKQEWLSRAIDYTTSADQIISFSQRLNSDNMIFAPGADINSTSSDGGFDINDGTSFATPHVTGAVALIQEAALEFAGRKYTPNEVVQIIRSTAQSIYDGDNENDNVTNTNISYPRLNIYSAVVATQTQGHKEITQYGASYGDLIATFGYDLKAFAKHYREFGQQEGRSRDKFDEFRYIASYSDLIVTFKLDGDGATKHYIQSGYRENRSVIFDEFRYIASYSDLIVTFKLDGDRATKHYIQSGYRENRSVTFDTSRYLASNPDLILVLNKNRNSATQHFITNGYYEQRATNRFEPKQYLASYIDLLGVFGVNLAAATDHFVNNGYEEKRSSDRFDEYSYIASYPDLIHTFRTNGDAATDHYLTYGVAEHRSITFDPFSYMRLNPDVAVSYNFNPLEATKHYINYGYDEGRRMI